MKSVEQDSLPTFLVDSEWQPLTPTDNTWLLQRTVKRNQFGFYEPADYFLQNTETGQLFRIDEKDRKYLYKDGKWERYLTRRDFNKILGTAIGLGTVACMGSGLGWTIWNEINRRDELTYQDQTQLYYPKFGNVKSDSLIKSDIVGETQVPLFSQNDPAWAGILLGYNTDYRYTIGTSGCLITSLAMYLQSIGRNETPLTINQKLVDGGGYAPGSGNFFWGNGPEILELQQVHAFHRDTDQVTNDQLTYLISLLQQGFKPLMEIDANPVTAEEEMHFVLGVGVQDDNSIVINDPWTGTTRNLSDYGDSSRAIIQYRIYQPILG